MQLINSHKQVNNETYVAEVLMELVVDYDQLDGFKHIIAIAGEADLVQILGKRFLEILKEQKLL